jgi:hypothetical protein
MYIPPMQDISCKEKFTTVVEMLPGGENVGETLVYPWSVFGKLRIEYPPLEFPYEQHIPIYFASGVLIGEKLVLTTSLAIYYRGPAIEEAIEEALNSNIGYAESLPQDLPLNFTPAHYPLRITFTAGNNQISSVDRIIFHPVHIKGTSTNNQEKVPLALLRLTHPIGKRTGSLEPKILQQEKLQNKTKINVSGYSVHGGLNTAKGIISDLTRENLYYTTIDTVSGHGGGGIWTEEENDEYYLIGIHIYNYHNKLNLKGGVRFTENTLRLIEKWKNYLTK